MCGRRSFHCAAGPILAAVLRTRKVTSSPVEPKLVGSNPDWNCCIDTTAPSMYRPCLVLGCAVLLFKQDGGCLCLPDPVQSRHHIKHGTVALREQHSFLRVLHCHSERVLLKRKHHHRYRLKSINRMINNCLCLGTIISKLRMIHGWWIAQNSNSPPASSRPLIPPLSFSLSCFLLFCFCLSPHSLVT